MRIDPVALEKHFKSKQFTFHGMAFSIPVTPMPVIVSPLLQETACIIGIVSSVDVFQWMFALIDFMDSKYASLAVWPPILQSFYERLVGLKGQEYLAFLNCMEQFVIDNVELDGVKSDMDIGLMSTGHKPKCYCRRDEERLTKAIKRCEEEAKSISDFNKDAEEEIANAAKLKIEIGQRKIDFAAIAREVAKMALKDNA